MENIHLTPYKVSVYRRDRRNNDRKCLLSTDPIDSPLLCTGLTKLKKGGRIEIEENPPPSPPLRKWEIKPPLAPP